MLYHSPARSRVGEWRACAAGAVWPSKQPAGSSAPACPLPALRATRGREGACRPLVGGAGMGCGPLTVGRDGGGNGAAPDRLVILADPCADGGAMTGSRDRPSGSGRPPQTPCRPLRQRGLTPARSDRHPQGWGGPCGQPPKAASRGAGRRLQAPRRRNRAELRLRLKMTSTPSVTPASPVPTALSGGERAGAGSAP